MNKMLLVFAVLITTSCGGKKNGGKSPEDFQQNDPIKYTKASNYQSPCVAHTEVDEAGTTYVDYTKKVFTMREDDEGTNSIALMELSFSDDKCSLATLETRLIAGGEFSSNKTYFAANFVSATIKPIVPEMVEVFNELEACGYTDWVVNREKDVLKAGCFMDFSTADIQFDDPYAFDQKKISVKICFHHASAGDECRIDDMTKF